MELPYIKQNSEPLFPKVLWNRPVAKRSAGRLLVLSGHSGDLATPQTIYQAAIAAGIGDCQVVLPDAVRKLVGDLPMAAYVPSSPSGSLGKASLGHILELAMDADAVLIGGGLSHNSETTMVVERLINETTQPLIIADDALALMKHHLKSATGRDNTLLVTDMVGLIKAAGPLEIPVHIRRDGGLNNRVEIVQEYLSSAKASYFVSGPEIMVGSEGQVSVTPYDVEAAFVPGLSAGVAGVFWTQMRSFEGLSSAAFVLAQATAATESKTASAIAEAVSKVVDRF